MKIRTKILWIAYLTMLVLFSCSEKQKKHKPVIVGKYYTNFWGNPMPKCICRFYYQEYKDGDNTLFEDSCNLYKVGDTLTK